MPRYAIANGFDLPCPTCVPDELKGLSLVEERLIALSGAFGTLVKLDAGGASVYSQRHHGIKGHHIVRPQRVLSVFNLLPSPIWKVCESIKVVWVGKHPPNEWQQLRRLTVRKNRVLKALH